MLDAIATASQGTLSAAVFFGSRSSGVATNASSAYDLMLVCEDAPAFYRAMQGARYLRRSPTVLRLLDPWLPPTQIRLAGADWLVKASVLSMRALLIATSDERKDQFLAGRLFQDVHVVWIKDETAAQSITAALESARLITLDWVRPDLPKRFDVAGYVRQLFRTSFRFEVRPETKGRADALFDAQSERLVPMFRPMLDHYVASGRMSRIATGEFAIDAPVEGHPLAHRLFLEWSRVRATARWPKHAVTFDGWLDYIVRKAERHSGETIVLTPIERSLPFIFLWPRAVAFLWRQSRKSRTV
ncbi:MAG: hypothetical protein ABI672_09785 [Vicinamibacteria bacterium]